MQRQNPASYVSVRTLTTALALGALLSACGDEKTIRRGHPHLPLTADAGTGGTGLDATAAGGAVAPAPATAARGAAAPAAPAAPVCAADEHRYALDRGSSLSWIITKSDGAPVVGTHPASGVVTLIGADPLATAAMSLDFDANGAVTGQDLRDARLQSYVFALGRTTTRLGFTLATITTASGNATLPEAGMSEWATLTGQVAVGIMEADVQIPVVLTMLEDGSLHVTEGLGGAHLDFRTDLGIAAPVDALLALVGVVIDDAIHLRFNMTLHDTCAAPATLSTP